MNKIKTLVIASLIFFSGTYLTNAQTEIVSLDNVAKARLVAPLILSKKGDAELNFGGIVLLSTAANDVVMAPGGGRTFIAAAAREISTATEQGTTPEFNLSGEVDLAYYIIIPENDVVKVTLQGTDGDVTSNNTDDPSLFGVNQQMEVKDFNYRLNAVSTHDADDNDVTHTYTDNTTFEMGATLAIGDSQIKGVYKGSYEVTVAYE